MPVRDKGSIRMRTVTGLLMSVTLAITVTPAEAIDLSCTGVMHTYKPKHVEATVDAGVAVVDLEQSASQRLLAVSG